MRPRGTQISPRVFYCNWVARIVLAGDRAYERFDPREMDCGEGNPFSDSWVAVCGTTYRWRAEPSGRSALGGRHLGILPLLLLPVLRGRAIRGPQFSIFWVGVGGALSDPKAGQAFRAAILSQLARQHSTGFTDSQANEDRESASKAAGRHCE